MRCALTVRLHSRSDAVISCQHFATNLDRKVSNEAVIRIRCHINSDEIRARDVGNRRHHQLAINFHANSERLHPRHRSRGAPRPAMQQHRWRIASALRRHRVQCAPGRRVQASNRPLRATEMRVGLRPEGRGCAVVRIEGRIAGPIAEIRGDVPSN